MTIHMQRAITLRRRRFWDEISKDVLIMYMVSSRQVSNAIPICGLVDYSKLYANRKSREFTFLINPGKRRTEHALWAGGLYSESEIVALTLL